MALNSQKWGYVRIITGTVLGGVLGFYVMHRVEVSYKVKTFLCLLSFSLFTGKDGIFLEFKVVEVKDIWFP